MQKSIILKLLPSEAVNELSVKQYIAKSEGVNTADVSGYTILKRSIDARGKQAWINLTIQAFIKEPYAQRKPLSFRFKDIANAEKK